MISVIIVNHNYKKYIDKCVNSVLKNNSNLIKEIIIIDDSSSANEKSYIFKKYNKINKVKFYEVKYKNLSKTLNFAINKAKGEWIFKLDADDYINENLNLEFTKYINKYDFIFGDLIIFSGQKKKRIKQNVKKNSLKFFKHPIGSGNLYKKKLWRIIRGYNENYYYKDDAYFWSKIVKINKIKIKYVNKTCYYYRKHNNSMSKNFFKKYITLLKIIFLN